VLRGVAALTAASALPRVAVAQPARTVVRVASTLDDSITPVLYGVQSGIFERLGLDVQLEPGASGSALAAAVVSGAVDIGKSSPISLCAAHVRGVPLQIVDGSALYLSDDPITALIVPKNSPIRAGADLNGKLAATPALQSLDQIATQAWVDDHGGDASTVHFVELPQQSVVSALQAGRIDAATLVVPTLAQALASGQFRILGRPFDAIGKRFLIAVWFSSRDYIARNTDAVRRFNDGFAQAAAYTNTHHAETVAMLAAYAHLEPAVIGAMTRTTSALHLDPKDLQPVIDAAAKYKVIPKAFPAAELM
jgi:NitT/TauT family transport system substrate-binding protein